jgi:prolyl oligopeptidase
MKATIAILCLCATMMGAGLAANDAPPPARQVATAEDTFGLSIPDPYRWMEGEPNGEFAAWLQQQGDYGRRQLDRLPRLSYWRERLGEVARGGIIHRLQTPMAGRIFFLRLEGGHEGVLMVRDRDGGERKLLDPSDQSSALGAAAITGFTPSWDGNLVAVNVQAGGAEITAIRVLDVNTSKVLEDRVEDVWGELFANWLPDNSGFTYSQLAPAATRDAADFTVDQRVRLHRLGSPAASDSILIARDVTPEVAMDPHEFPLLFVPKGSHFSVLEAGGARPEMRVCVAPSMNAVPTIEWHCLIGYEDNVQQIAVHGDVLYAVSMRDAPNGQLLKLDLSQSLDFKKAVRVLPEAQDAVLTGLAAADDAIYVRRLQGGPDGLLRITYSDHVQPVSLPFVGSILILAADPDAPGALFTLQGWIVPRMAFHIGAGAQLEDLRLGATVTGNYTDLLAEETTVKSTDGSLVPLSIIRRRDVTRTHSDFALLDGYGAYGISEQPTFDPLLLEWVKAGHVYAVAHVRGGGEKGERWRLGGSGTNKERGIEDYIACARALESHGWAKHGKVIGTGGSMGGILVGGAITRAPSAFGAVIIQAGELNPSRLIAAANGANQFAEVGDPRLSEGLRTAAAMDPYLRIKDGAPYPAVLLIVGLNDHRVPPWASGKFGARLLGASHSQRPIWFRTDGATGHFSTAQSARALELADAFAFAEAALH